MYRYDSRDGLYYHYLPGGSFLLKFFLICLVAGTFQFWAKPLILGFGNIQARWWGFQSSAECRQNLEGFQPQIFSSIHCGG